VTLSRGAAIRVSYKAASDIIGKAATFLVLLEAARFLSTSAFGILSLASTLGWMLAVATDLGLQLHLAREVARGQHSLRSIVLPLLRVRSGLAAGAIVLTCLAFAWLPSTDALAFVLIGAAYVVSGLVEFINYVYRALARSELESSLNLIQRLATLAAAVLLLRQWPALLSVAVAFLLPSMVVLAVTSVVLSRILAERSTIDAAPPASTFSRTAFVLDVLPIGAGIVLSALYFRVDLFLVQYWRGIEDVARYNAVFRLIDALRLFPAAVLTVLLPVVFRPRHSFFVWRLSAGLFAFGTVTAVAVRAAAPLVMSLTFGSKYESAVPVLRILLIAFPALCVNYALTHQVIGQGSQRAYAAGCALALLFNIGLNLILIPSLGIAGAAWSTVATELALTCGWIWIIRRQAPVTTAASLAEPRA
jgi:O-antigen/teichoic acid export membrane protein